MRKFVFLFVLAAAFITAAFCSCNVTRKVTTESSYHQHGDTTVQIVTKTIETYDASKH